MSGFWSFRRLVTCSVLAAAVASGGYLYGQSTQPAPAPAADSGSIATINGRDINSKLFRDTLMEIDGMRLFETFRDLALVQGDCLTNGIPVDGDDFQKRFKEEFDNDFDRLGIKITVPAGEKVTDEMRQQAMGQVLAQRGVNIVQYRLGLETRTGLRALAKGRVDVSDDDVKDQWAAEYGKVFHARVFPVTNVPVDVQAKIRDEIAKGKKPDDVADDLKLGAKPGGVNVPESIKEKDKSKFVAELLQMKVGDLSAAIDLPVQAGQPAMQGMIYLESIDPDRTKDNPYAKVAEDVRKQVFDAKQDQWMNNHLIMLRANATITINDPILKKQYDAIEKAVEQQAAAAATQPGGAPTTPASAPASPGGMAPPTGGAAPHPTPMLPPIPGAPLGR